MLPLLQGPDTLGNFVERNCCQQQSRIVCHATLKQLAFSCNIAQIERRIPGNNVARNICCRQQSCVLYHRLIKDELIDVKVCMG